MAPSRKPQPESQQFISRNLNALSVCAALLAATWFIYGQITSHGLINFDDYDYVGENHAVLNGLTWDGIVFAFTTKLTANWHPVTWLSHMLDVELFGPFSNGAMHGVSAWIHACNGILLFVLLRYFTGALWRSAAVAGLFVVHPLHVEPVAWLSDRKDLLATFFWFATALTWGFWAKERRSWGWFALAHLWAALAMMSKPTTVTLPFTLLLLDLWPLGRMASPRHAGRLVLEKGLLFAMAAAQSVITFLVQREVGAMTALRDVPLTHKAANAVSSYGVYLWQTFWPDRLCPMYPFPQSPDWIRVSAAALLLAAGTVLALARIRRQPYIAAGWFWYLGVLIPMVGLVQVGIQAHADRYTYVALTGIFWMLAWGLHDLLGTDRWRSPAMRTAVIVVFLALTWKSYAQAALWQSDQTLFGHTLSVTQRNRLAHTIVGLAYFRSEQLDQAESHLRTALDLDPAFMQTYRDLAELMYAKKRPEDALPLLNKAAELVPEGPITYYSRGIVLRALNRPSEAAADFERALKIGLDLDRAKRSHLELGLIQSKLEKHAEAIPHFERALGLDPFYYLALKNLAYARFYTRDFKDALARFQNLARSNPSDPDVRNMLKVLSSPR